MRKIIIIAVGIIAIASLNACKSTNTCSSIEKQEIKTNESQNNLEVNV